MAYAPQRHAYETNHSEWRNGTTTRIYKPMEFVEPYLEHEDDSGRIHRFKAAEREERYDDETGEVYEEVDR